MSRSGSAFSPIALLSDSPDSEKIRRRTQRHYPQGYDYRLDIGEPKESSTFSFLVVGDTGMGETSNRAKFHVADRMAEESETDFIVHLGDMVYMDGSKEGYKDHFIKPFHHWLKDGSDHEYDNMVFTKPLIPLLGNHDYFNLGEFPPEFTDPSTPLSELPPLLQEFGSGSDCGAVFAKAFIQTEPRELKNRRLVYSAGVPGETKVPNRYYWFTYGNCAFFVLDSNTLDGFPEPNEERRNRATSRLNRLQCDEQYYMSILKYYQSEYAAGRIGQEALKIELSPWFHSLIETQKDMIILQKALESDEADYDSEQIAWFKKVLKHPDVEGKWKIVLMHHPFYSSNRSHAYDPESDSLYSNLRQTIVAHGVHAVITGHAHSFEWMSEVDNNERSASNICYIIAGGGGFTLMPSILEDNTIQLAELLSQDIVENSLELRKRRELLHLVKSEAYTALNHGVHQEVFSYLRLDVADETLKLIPVGVAPCGADGAGNERLSPIPVRRMKDRDSLEHAFLDAIHVTRDAKPLGVWQ